MSRIQELNRQISELTEKIEKEYPELYQHLDENPITLPESSNPEVDFEEYLESLKALLNKHLEAKKSK